METEKGTKSNQQAAKTTDGKAAAAEMVPQPTESLDRQGKKPLGKKPWVNPAVLEWRMWSCYGVDKLFKLRFHGW